MAKAKKIKPLTGNAGDFSGIVLKAAASGNIPAVRQYLKHNPRWLNQEGPHGRTLLWEAAYKGRTELVAELIERGANVSPFGSYYTPMLVELSALAVARQAGRDELAELLEKNGATDDLYAACHRGDLEAINRFLSRSPADAQRPARDEPPHPRMGFHPVHYAVAGKQLGALRLLVGFGADLNEHAALLLDWADGDRELVRFLREQTTGGKSQHKSKRKTSAATVPPKARAAETKKIPAIDRPDWMGFPALVDACRGNHNAPDEAGRVKKLLARGANVNVQDHKQKTPLHRACQAGFIEITKLLLKQGALLEIEDEKGCTPVFDAAHHGRTDTLQLMMNHGADIHHIDGRGETPLFAAARGAKENTFVILLEAGADLAHANNRQKTVEQIVRAARHRNDARRNILDRIQRHRREN